MADSIPDLMWGEFMEEYNDAIFEIQLWLRELYFAGYPIEEIIPDGIFDAKTRKAVIDFQKYAGLPASGVVDRETWDAMYEAYNKARFDLSRPSPIYPFPENDGYVTSPGEASDIVIIVQLLLNSLSAHYDGIVVPVSGVYDIQTQRAAQEFQRKSALAPTGLVDKATWNHLTEVYHRLNRIDT